MTSYTYNLAVANWSFGNFCQGVVIFCPQGINAIDKQFIEYKRTIYNGSLIFVSNNKASVVTLAQWPDKNSSIVTGGGGNTSEEMNYARSGDFIYINGAGDNIDKLKQYEGSNIRIINYCEKRQPLINDLPDKLRFLESVPIQLKEYFSKLVTNPDNLEILSTFLQWAVEGSTVNLTPKQMSYVEEVKEYAHKSYPQKAQNKTKSEVVRAIGRFAFAREKNNLVYAEEIAWWFSEEVVREYLLRCLKNRQA